MNIFRKLLGAAALAFVGLASFSMSTPAQAAVRTCTDWLAGQTNYPNNGHLKKCFPAPLTAAETNLQNFMMNDINSAIAGLQAAEKTQMNLRDVTVHVFYNGTDALDTIPDPSGVTLKQTETGRSYVLSTSPGPNPKLLVWAFTQSQWAALNNARPTTYIVQQLQGTLNHEAGHHADRFIAQQNGYAPTASALMTNNTTQNPIAAQSWIKAFGFDAAKMSSSDVAYMVQNFPRLMTKVLRNDPANPGGPQILVDAVRTNELFAELFAGVHNGGAGGLTSSEAVYINAHFKCSRWVIIYMKTKSGQTPPAPPSGGTVNAPSECYNKQAWTDAP